MYALIRKVEAQSPLMKNTNIGYVFLSKFQSFEIIHRYAIISTKNLFKAARREKNDLKLILLLDATKHLQESIAFFEAYLNAFYSFFQVMAKITPYFYDQKALRVKIPDDYFEKQQSFFLKNNGIDAEYAQYIKNDMPWYDEIVCNRNGITHNASAFLAFGKDGQIEFIHMPKKKIDYLVTEKPFKSMLDYMDANWESLFNFLDFYVKHFDNKEIYVDLEVENEKIKEITKVNTLQPF